MSKPNTNIIRCTHCGSYEYKKNGKSNGHQNYICKKCKRSFSDRVKKFTYDDKERFLKYYLNNVGIRKAAKFMNCSPSLLIKWLREFINNLKLDLDKAKNKLDKNIPDIIEMDEARSGSKSSLLEFASLSSHEVPTEQSEDEARSQTMMCLHNHCSLSVSECLVPLTGLLVQS